MFGDTYDGRAGTVRSRTRTWCCGTRWGSTTSHARRTSPSCPPCRQASTSSQSTSSRATLSSSSGPPWRMTYRPVLPPLHDQPRARCHPWTTAVMFRCIYRAWAWAWAWAHMYSKPRRANWLTGPIHMSLHCCVFLLALVRTYLVQPYLICWSVLC